MVMTCREFEQAWQVRLDAGDPPVDGALEAHAAACAACRVRGERYRGLALVLNARVPAPSPPPDLVDRVLARYESERRRLSFRWPSAGVATIPRLSAAAAVVLAAAALWATTRPAPEVAPRPAPAALASAPRPLSASLSAATSATLELAVATSAPAARLGRLALESAAQPAAGRDEGATSPSEPAEPLIRTVGNRVASGVRPLTGTARRAFGFLLSPAPADRPGPAATGRSRGA